MTLEELEPYNKARRYLDEAYMLVESRDYQEAREWVQEALFFIGEAELAKGAEGGDSRVGA